MIKHKLSDLIQNQLPRHISEIKNSEGVPTFTEFIKAYYQFLETQQVYRNIETVRDLDQTLDIFLDTLKSEYAAEFPEFAKSRYFLKNVSHINTSHGSELSYKFLFRQMFKKEVDIRYPQDQVMSISDSIWVQETSFFIRLKSGDVTELQNNFIYLTTKVNGKASKTRVYVKRVEVVETDATVFEIFIDNKFYGVIRENDTITYGTVSATVIPTTTKIKVIKPGSNFRVGQVFTVESTSTIGSGLTFDVLSVDSTGGIKTARILRYGVNYKTNFTFDLPSLVELGDGVVVDGFKVTSKSVQKRLQESGVISKQDYYGDYATDYAGDVVGNFYDTTVGESIEVNSAKLSIQLGTIAKYPGYYANSTGLVSSPDSIIQDSNYYQRFSYVLRIDEAFSTYKEAVLSLLHPAGRKIFAEYVIDNLYELDYEVVEPIFKILLPIFAGVPTVATMLDSINLTIQKPIESSVDMSQLEIVAKHLQRPIPDSIDTPLDSNNYAFDLRIGLTPPGANPEDLRPSFVTPQSDEYWNMTSLKSSTQAVDTQLVNYSLQKPFNSSALPTSNNTYLFASLKNSSIDTPSSINTYHFQAQKSSTVIPTTFLSYVDSKQVESSFTSVSARAYLFNAPKASSQTVSDSSVLFLQLGKNSVLTTPTDGITYVAQKQLSSSFAQTSASVYSLSYQLTSTLAQPTSAPSYLNVKTLTSSFTQTSSAVIGYLRTVASTLPAQTFALSFNVVKPQSSSLSTPTSLAALTTARPASSSISTPADSSTLLVNKALSSSTINSDGGKIFFNRYDSVTNNYFADDTYIISAATII